MVKNDKWGNWRNKDVIKNLWLFIHVGALMHFAAIRQHYQKAVVDVYTYWKRQKFTIVVVSLWVRTERFVIPNSYLKIYIYIYIPHVWFYMHACAWVIISKNYNYPPSSHLTMKAFQIDTLRGQTPWMKYRKIFALKVLEDLQREWTFSVKRGTIMKC